MPTITADPNAMIIHALVFLLGLLIGGFMFSGGGRKWKHRYNAEVDRRRELEERHEAAEREWRERDSLRGAALKGRDSRDTNRDGVVSANEAAVSPVVSDSRDTNRDGVVSSREADDGLVHPARDLDNDGIDDRRER